MWIIMSVLSAVFAGITSILAKCGINKTDSDVATALRTVVVLIFSWVMVFVVGSFDTVSAIAPRSLVFLVLSGISTGASWICYFKALSIGNVNKVVPIDKSSTIITIILAIIVFNETNNLRIKVAGIILLSVGTFMMINKKDVTEKNGHGPWLIYAVFSAIFAALTSILAKVGISGVESNVGTAIRTGVVLVMAWIIVFIKGKKRLIRHVDRKELLFIALSGVATGASWLCYYYAIQNGIVSVVVPIDKMSIVVSIAFSYFVFKEKLSKKALVGLIIIAGATLVMAIWS